MAKRKHQSNQIPGARALSLKPSSLAAVTQDRRDAPYLYANHAQFSINMNEIFMDLYHLSPEPGDTGNVEALLIQRVVIPIGLGKGFATGMANLIAGYEKTTGNSVPMNRKADPEDQIKIWEDE